MRIWRTLSDGKCCLTPSKTQGKSADYFCSLLRFKTKYKTKLVGDVGCQAVRPRVSTSKPQGLRANRAGRSRKRASRSGEGGQPGVQRPGNLAGQFRRSAFDEGARPAFAAKRDRASAPTISHQFHHPKITRSFEASNCQVSACSDIHASIAERRDLVGISPRAIRPRPRQQAF